MADVSGFPRLVTAEQMAAIDRRAIASGVSGVDLMERAGARVLETLAERWHGLAGLRVAVVCGKGNNGGDGLVVARLLAEEGVAVETWLGADRAELTGDAARLLLRLEAAGNQPHPLPEEHADAVEALQLSDIIVDALLGTGLCGAPRAPQARIIQIINDCPRPVLAVDLPSGVDAADGHVESVAVSATVTVTFELTKVGHLFPPGRGHCGVLEVVDIGIPQSAIEPGAAGLHLLTTAGISPRVPRRQTDAHKGTCGSVAVIAGSVGMTGAAALAAEAALRSGAGRTTLGVPASLNDILEVKVTEAMTKPLPEVRRRRCLSLRALGEITALLRSADAGAIGPGLGRYRETVALVRRLLADHDLPPMVIDADALYAIGDDHGLLGPDRIITPHAGEFGRLTGCSRQRVADEPVPLAAEFAQRQGCVVILKGGPTVIAAPDGQVYVNPTGNAGMATAGSGDVLTGLIAGLLAQGSTPLSASLCGVFLHGLAGDRTRDRLGEWGMLAGDLLPAIASAFVEVVAHGGQEGALA